MIPAVLFFLDLLFMAVLPEHYTDEVAWIFIVLIWIAILVDCLRGNYSRTSFRVENDFEQPPE